MFKHAYNYTHYKMWFFFLVSNFSLYIYDFGR